MLPVQKILGKVPGLFLSSTTVTFGECLAWAGILLLLFIVRYLNYTSGSWSLVKNRIWRLRIVHYGACLHWEWLPAPSDTSIISIKVLAMASPDGKSLRVMTHNCRHKFYLVESQECISTEDNGPEKKNNYWYIWDGKLGGGRSHSLILRCWQCLNQ